jgi:plasmid stabilization system protein ParE
LERVRIARLAEIEFREATLWYRDRDPRVADRFTAEIGQVLGLIEAYPHVGTQVSGADREVRRMPVRTFPYDVVFVELIDTLEVVAIAHQRRRPGYNFDRLPQT